MKTPLIYQMTPYGGGSTSVINALRYLFEREEIVPELLIHTYETTLDDFDDTGSRGRQGTSYRAMRHISRYSSAIGQAGLMPIESAIAHGEDARMAPGSTAMRALAGGAAGVARVWYEGHGHYVLLTGVEDGRILAFDPYLTDRDDFGPGVTAIDRPMQANRLIDPAVLHAPGRGDYTLQHRGNDMPDEPPVGEIVLFWRTDRPDWRAAG